MNNYLKQVRKGTQKLIDENISSIAIEYESDLSDPWASKTIREFTGRLSHKSRPVVDLADNPAGLSNNGDYYLLVNHKTDFLQEGNIIYIDPEITDDVITNSSSKWKLGPIDMLKKFGGIHGYQIDLTEAN